MGGAAREQVEGMGETDDRLHDQGLARESGLDRFHESLDQVERRHQHIRHVLAGQHRHSNSNRVDRAFRIRQHVGNHRALLGERRRALGLVGMAPHRHQLAAAGPAGVGQAVLDSIDRINLTRKFIEGYTIQVYSGMKREDAMNAKKQLTTVIPSLESELQYVQPNFRVKTGKYFNRLEAQKDFDMIKRFFPDAIIVPDKIAIN